MSTFIEKTLSLPLAARLLLAVSLGAFGFVLTMQYGFGLNPCILCLWQRVPYAIVGILSLILLLAKPRPAIAATLLGFCVIAFLAGMGVGIFHSGVELHWWLGTSSCSFHAPAAGSPEEMREALLHTVAPRCDEIAWTIFGLSMANLNSIGSLLCAFFAAAAAAKAVEKR